ncbi:MAG TPA: hypothetical protein VLE23_16405 [Geminicoccaceae bacterium]|nr:hypothetical protein [Geminicoccaceae bacterium]
MAIENLPRPWLLAALTGLKVTELVSLEGGAGADRRAPGAPPRPEPRRRRLRPVTGDDRPGQPKDAWLN